MDKEYGDKRSPLNWMCQSRAIANQDIYKNEGVNLDNIDEIVKTKVLIIVSQQDHLVNPISSVELSKVLKCNLYELTGDCGHIAVFCELDKVQQAVSAFLNN